MEESSSHSRNKPGGSQHSSPRSKTGEKRRPLRTYFPKKPAKSSSSGRYLSNDSSQVNCSSSSGPENLKTSSLNPDAIPFVLQRGDINYDPSPRRQYDPRQIRDKRSLHEMDRSTGENSSYRNENEYSQRDFSDSQPKNTNKVIRNRIGFVMPLQNLDPGGESSQQQNESKSTKTEHAKSQQCDKKENQLEINYECMICYDTIYRPQAIWSCSKCYNIFHLKCAKGWCDKSIRARDELTSGSTNFTGDFEIGQTTTMQNHRNRIKSSEWSCPACREVNIEKPHTYKCFCAKIIRPEPKKYLTPHSCGQICGRERVECDHLCPLLCHPGACEKCMLTSNKPCFCNKTSQQTKCSLPPSSCGSICDKVKDCGYCRCEEICHEGSCKPCKLIVKLECHCNKKHLEKKCIDSTRDGNGKPEKFSCGQICNQLLECGNHRCTEKCHPERCPSCKFSNENLKKCPCGSTMLKKSLVEARKSCTDLIPSCGKKCGKTLICGHKCEKKCHSSNCPPCKHKSSVKCKCGLTSKTIDCRLMFEEIKGDNDELVIFKQKRFVFDCIIKCSKFKNCKRHKCNTVCCEARNIENSPSHKCDSVCGKKLSCGKHFCQEICQHPFSCGDCPNLTWDPLSCHCGTSVIQPPITCTTKPPVCDQPCRRQHNCDHPVRHTCYNDGDPQTSGCAPCTFFVKKSCFCGADSKETVYCYLPGYSCSKRCNRQFPKCYHRCERICHNTSVQPCIGPDEACKRPCKQPRFSCIHPCALPCHGLTPTCPRSDCRVVIERKCDCGHKNDKIDCYKLTQDASNAKQMLSIMSRTNDESILINLSKKEHTKKSDPTRLECDETCQKAKDEAFEQLSQADKLAIALGIEDPLQVLKEAIAMDYDFAYAVYQKLVTLVKGAQNSSKRFMHLKMDPANDSRRRITCELASHFGCTTMCFEEEPYRYVMVRAYGTKSCEPVGLDLKNLIPIRRN